MRTDADVAGDYMGFGGQVTVAHRVGVDATLAGGTVQVSAPIGDDLRVAGGTVVVKAPVGGEWYGAAGDLRLTPEGSIAGDAALAAGNLAIDGRIAGSLRAAARTIVINGEVAGDVRLNARHIALGPKARIGGALSYSSTEPMIRAEGAVVAGAVTDSRAESRRTERDARAAEADLDEARHGEHRWLPMGLGSVFGYLMLLALAALMLWLAPRFAGRAAAAVAGSPWRSLGLGLLLVVVVPLVAVLLVLTLLGIPFALALLAFYPLLTMLGFVVAAVALGQRLRRGFGAAPIAAIPSDAASLQPAPAPAPTPTPSVGLAALGLLVLMLLGWLPFVGWLLLTVATLAGLGAVVLAIARGRRPEPV